VYFTIVEHKHGECSYLTDHENKHTGVDRNEVCTSRGSGVTGNWVGGSHCLLIANHGNCSSNKVTTEFVSEYMNGVFVD
jgi:hypothetical protein